MNLRKMRLTWTVFEAHTVCFPRNYVILINRMNISINLRDVRHLSEAEIGRNNRMLINCQDFP